MGALIVHGPASANYDIDLGPYMITDYYYETADRLMRRAELVSNGAPPKSDNILFRGKNISPTGKGGQYDRLTLTPGKKHLLRLINTSVDNSLTVTLAGHSFTVISTDLVPVTPTVRSSLFMGVGQRYDVIVEANQKVDNYWLNVTLEKGGNCGDSRNPFPAAVMHYDGAGTGNPTSRGSPVTAGCSGESGFVPIVKRTAPRDQFQPQQLNVDLTFPTTQAGQVFRWVVNKTPIVVEWDHPVLEYVAQGNTTYPASVNTVVLQGQADTWTFFVVQNSFSLPHPVHLHGHDFLLLGVGSGVFDSSHTSSLQFDNPVRRDVAQMPGNGWIVMGFRAVNPGWWLLHCHIGWHVSQGLGIQFLERRSEIRSMMHLNQLQPNCDAWRTYQKTAAWLPKLDSGLR